MIPLPGEYLELLFDLIRTPSLSGEENRTAEILGTFFMKKGWLTNRKGNNLWTTGALPLDGRPIVLMNAHHDTVPPNSGYTRDPYTPEIENGKLYGLGSNDDGGALVCLMAAFESLQNEALPFQLLLLCSAEEENSGPGGVTLALGELPEPTFGLVGEPTGMAFAAAEKGLMVVDAVIHGQAGHAARDTGINAIYQALPFLDWVRAQPFVEESPLLGRARISATQINAGIRHNVTPAECHLVLDIRSTDTYNNEGILKKLQDQWPDIKFTARSTRLKASALSKDHTAYRTAEQMGLTIFGSPTLSDQALMRFPTAKMGPGISERSHTADEFITLEELTSGWRGYVDFILELAKNWR